MSFSTAFFSVTYGGCFNYRPGASHRGFLAQQKNRLDANVAQLYGACETLIMPLSDCCGPHISNAQRVVQKRGQHTPHFGVKRGRTYLIRPKTLSPREAYTNFKWVQRGGGGAWVLHESSKPSHPDNLDHGSTTLYERVPDCCCFLV